MLREEFMFSKIYRHSKMCPAFHVPKELLEISEVKRSYSVRSKCISVKSSVRNALIVLKAVPEIKLTQ